MDSEEVIKIDLSQKVSTPQQQKKEISHKVSLIKLEISSPADANAYYTIDKGDKPVQGQTTISKSGDSGCYVKTINAEEYRNSSLMVRCYAFNQIHTELTLKIAPPQLLVKSALFKKDGATVGDNCLDIVSDTNFVITVELTRPILDGENAKLHYKRYHKEPGGNVFKEYKTDTVDLKKNDRFKDITFYAPENHSGGTMAVSFYINEPIIPYNDVVDTVYTERKNPPNQNVEKGGAPHKYKWAHSEFGNLIAQKESSDNYNICNQTKGGLKVISNVRVVNLTIKQIQEKQAAKDVFAVGRYQLIPNTLNDAITKLKLNINDKLNEEMQDKIFDEYLIKLKRPKIIAYLEESGTVQDAMYAASLEWASIGVEKGKRISDKITKDKDGNITSREKRYAKGGESYYAGDGLNKAHITPEKIKKTLEDSKNANK